MQTLSSLIMTTYAAGRHWSELAGISCWLPYVSRQMTVAILDVVEVGMVFECVKCEELGFKWLGFRLQWSPDTIQDSNMYTRLDHLNRQTSYV